MCESCNRQLLQQWDEYQKINKPVSERYYKLVRTSKPNAVLSFPFHHDLQGSSSSVSAITNSVPATATSNAVLRNHIIPSISSTQILNAASTTKTLFSCVVCSKDLLLSAAQVSVSGQSHSSNAHIAFSMLTEMPTANDSVAGNHTLVKKLIVQSAQELNLLPFLSNTNASFSASVQAQLQLLVESGRVLCCFSCFEAITSSRHPSTTTSSSSNPISNNVVHNSESVLKTVNGRTINGKVKLMLFSIYLF